MARSASAGAAAGARGPSCGSGRVLSPPPAREALPGYLVELGRRLLARVTRAPAGGRELALDLLAADAFVTYGFEAQAEAEVDGLTALAERVAGGREGIGEPRG